MSDILAFYYEVLLSHWRIYMPIEIQGEIQHPASSRLFIYNNALSSILRLLLICIKHRRHQLYSTLELQYGVNARIAGHSLSTPDTYKFISPETSRSVLILLKIACCCPYYQLLTTDI